MSLPSPIGTSHSLALRADGTVWAWGNNAQGQLGIEASAINTSPAQVSGLSGIQAIAAGANHSLALHTNGAVWVWGDNTYGQLGDGTPKRTAAYPLPSLSDIKAIAAGANHSLALRSNQTVVAWGMGQSRPARG